MAQSKADPPMPCDDSLNAEADEMGPPPLPATNPDYHPHPDQQAMGPPPADDAVMGPSPADDAVMGPPADDAMMGPPADDAVMGPPAAPMVEPPPSFVAGPKQVRRSSNSQGPLLAGSGKQDICLDVADASKRKLADGAPPPFNPDEDDGPKAGDGCLEGYCASPHLKATFTSALLLFMVVIIGVCAAGEEWEAEGLCNWYAAPSTFWPPFGIVAALYLVEVFSSSSRRYLSSIKGNDTVRHYIETMKGNAPTIEWRVVCYHSETRTRSTTDSNGNSSTETYTVTVETHRANMSYRFTSWRDVSPDVADFGRYLLTKVKYHKTFDFEDAATEADYYSKMEWFKRTNDLDECQSFYMDFNIDGFEKRMLQELVPGSRPAWMCLELYLLASMFLLTVPYRILFAAKCGRTRHTFVKRIATSVVQPCMH